MKDYYSVTADDFNSLHGVLDTLNPGLGGRTSEQIDQWVKTYSEITQIEPTVVKSMASHQTFEEFRANYPIKVSDFEAFIQEIKTLEAKVDNLWVTQSAIDSKLSELLLAQQGNDEESSQDTGKKKKYKVRNGFKAWTPEEEQFILDHPKWSNKSIAGRLHRTPTAIYVRKWRMVKEGRLPAES